MKDEGMKAERMKDEGSCPPVFRELGSGKSCFFNSRFVLYPSYDCYEN